MTLSKQDLGRRIAAAREASGLSQGALAATVGLGQSAVSRIETGERGVDSLELAAIASTLGVSVLDLLRPRPLAQSLRLAARRQQLAGCATLDRAIERIVDIAEVAAALDGEGTTARRPRRSGRGRAVDQGKRLAREVRNEWGLGNDPLPDLFGLIEERAGVLVVLEPLGGDLDGLCAHADALALIVVDSSAALGRQRFTAAHELCHFLLGEGSTLHVDERIFGQAVEEMRANAFAAHFLMPADGVDRYRRERPVDGLVATELQYTFGVSLDALLWHLLNLGAIDDEARRRLAEPGARALAYRNGYAAEWDRIEGERGIRRPPRPLLERALTAYGEGRLGIEPVARLWGRTDAEALRSELEQFGIGRDDRWWDSTDPA